jgi:hypothetical protein
VQVGESNEYDVVVTTLRVSSVTLDHAIGSFGSTVLYVSRTSTTLEALHLLRAEMNVARVVGGALSLFGVVEGAAALPSSEVRDGLADLLRDLGEKGGVASALTFEGRGFRASAVRSLTTGVALVARQRFPHRIFSTVPEAASWLVSTISASGPTTIDASDIVAAIAALRRR